jgi:hypothetical protein
MNKFGQVFMWDWKEQAPVGLIVKAASRNKKNKLFTVNDGSDTYTAIVATDKKNALKAYIQWNKMEFDKEDFKLFLEDLDTVEIVPWRDNY